MNYPFEISVIIPLFNKEKHIDRAIRSVLSQTSNDFEVIIVNDGSTDKSYEIASKISRKHENVKLICQKNKGVSSARNLGIKNALGKYVAFLDADDTWEKDFLKKIAELIECFPNAAMYASAYTFVDKSTKKVCKSFYKMKDGYKGYLDNYFKYALYEPIITSSSVVIRTCIFKSIGYFNESYKRGEDLDMWRRIAMSSNVAYINIPLANYHMDSINMATKNVSFLIESSANDSEKILHDSDYQNIYFKEYMIKSIYTKAKYLIYNNQEKKARLLLWKYRKTKYNKRLFLKLMIISFAKQIRGGKK